jgi:hypothetical protein
MKSELDDIILSITMALRVIGNTEVNPNDHKFSESFNLAISERRATLTMLTKSKRKLKRIQNEQI